MRLDKYLKVSRIIKRRTVANEACDAKHVTVNGKVARASYDVKVGDIIGAQLELHAHSAKLGVKCAQFIFAALVAGGDVAAFPRKKLY